MDLVDGQLDDQIVETTVDQVVDQDQCSRPSVGPCGYLNDLTSGRPSGRPSGR